MYGHSDIFNTPLSPIKKPQIMSHGLGSDFRNLTSKHFEHNNAYLYLPRLFIMWSYWPRLKAIYFTIKLDGLHGHQYHSFSFMGVEKISLIFNIFFQYGHIGPALRPIYTPFS